MELLKIVQKFLTAFLFRIIKHGSNTSSCFVLPTSRLQDRSPNLNSHPGEPMSPNLSLEELKTEKEDLAIRWHMVNFDDRYSGVEVGV